VFVLFIWCKNCMTTSESKSRFYLQNESIRITNQIESNRIANWNALVCTRTQSINLSWMLFGHQCSNNIDVYVIWTLLGFFNNLLLKILLCFFWCANHMLQQIFTNSLEASEHTQCQKIFKDAKSCLRCPNYMHLQGLSKSALYNRYI